MGSFNLVRNLFGTESYWCLNKTLVRKLGLKETLFFQYLTEKQLYYINKGEVDSEGYFFRIKTKIEIETGLSPYEQQLGMDKLIKLGWLKTKQQGLPKRTYYKLTEEIEKYLDYMKEEENGLNYTNNKYSKNLPSSTQKIYPPVLKKFDVIINNNINKEISINKKTKAKKENFESSEILELEEKEDTKNLFQKYYSPEEVAAINSSLTIPEQVNLQKGNPTKEIFLAIVKIFLTYKTFRPRTKVNDLIVKEIKKAINKYGKEKVIQAIKNIPKDGLFYKDRILGLCKDKKENWSSHVVFREQHIDRLLEIDYIPEFNELSFKEKMVKLMKKLEDNEYDWDKWFSERQPEISEENQKNNWYRSEALKIMAKENNFEKYLINNAKKDV